MSSALAIAGVTAVLADLLSGWLAEQPLPRSLGNPKVSALAPDLVDTGMGKPGQINLFMYQATLNPAWRSAGPPARDASGRRMANPPLALDLHYLLTAYGSQNFHAEMILGYAMQLLHETPILPRDEINRILLAHAERANDDFSATGLADQLEQIKISPAHLNTEELSKLWSAFQSRYRPSAAYEVSVVLIESSRPVRAPLPVLTRGANDRGPGVQEGIIPPFATLTAAVPPHQQPAICLGELLTLAGFHLDGASVAVRFANRRLPAPLVLAPRAEASANSLQVQLAGASDAWQAGVYAVSVAVTQADGSIQTSNALAVTLAPHIDAISASRTPSGVEVLVECSPAIWPGQAAALLLGERELQAEAFGQKTSRLTFRAEELPQGSYLARLRVDGIDSRLVDRSTTPPRFDPAQSVVVP